MSLFRERLLARLVLAHAISPELVKRLLAWKHPGFSAHVGERIESHPRRSSRFPGKGGNCGVLVHASKPRALYQMFPQSIEVQMMSGNAGDFWCIQEDIKVPDMETRRPRKPNEKWGGAEGDARRILNLTDGSEKPLGEWNTMVIEARGRSLTVWVNGDKVNDGFDATADRGKIALQAEGTEVEFRKVEIGPLPAATK